MPTFSEIALRRAGWWLAAHGPILACLAVVAGARLWLVATYGSATPYWDQWDAEADRLYKPYLEGNLDPADLLAHHNEHRILASRLWALLLFRLNGTWDPLLQMALNTFLHAAALGVLLALLWTLLPAAGQRLALAVFAALVFAVPFGWENTLAGFQSQFYLLLLVTFAALAAFHGQAAFASRWWLGLGLALASYLCMAGGALTLAPVIAVGGLQVALGQRRGAREYIALALMAALTLAMLRDVPALDYHAGLKAHSISAFLTGLVAATAWPLPAWAIGALLVNLPVLLCLSRLLASRAGPHDARWLCALLAVWLWAQAAALGYGRSVGTDASRFCDVFSVAVVLNFAALLHMLRTEAAARSWPAAAGAMLWLLALSAAFTQRTLDQVAPEVLNRQRTAAIQTANLRAYLASGDIAHLAGKPFLHIPYPEPERLARIAGDPTIRAILPVSLVPRADASPKDPGRLRKLKTLLLVWGVYLIPVGIALFFALAILPARREV